MTKENLGDEIVLRLSSFSRTLKTALLSHEEEIESIRNEIIYEVDSIVDHCKDSEGGEMPGWRFKAIREAAKRIEAAFVDSFGNSFTDERDKLDE